MIIKALFRGLMLLTLVLVFKASTYGDPLGMNNAGTKFNSDSSGVFITPGLDLTSPESNPGNSGLPTDKHDYFLGLDGFFMFDASALTHIQNGKSGTDGLGGFGGGAPWGYGSSSGGGEGSGTPGPGGFDGFGAGGGAPWGYASSAPDGFGSPTLDLAGGSSVGTVMVLNPEPSSLLLLGSGLAGVAYILRKRRVRNKAR